MAEIIKSKDNPLIKRITRLLSSAKGRREEGCFVCEGVRLCRDAVLSGAGILCFCCTEQAYSKNVEAAEMISSAAEKTVRVSPSLLSKLSDTDNPQGFLCIVRMNARAAEITPGRCYAALERIQDPSNLGTILRTAEALGISGVILSGDFCDIYSPKVVRGSMGAVFRLPFMQKDEPYQYADGSGSVINWYGGYRGYCSIRDGIRDSLNIIAVKTLTLVTPEVCFKHVNDLDKHLDHTLKFFLSDTGSMMLSNQSGIFI